MREGKPMRVVAGDDDSSYAQQCHHGRHPETEKETKFCFFGLWRWWGRTNQI